jgi:hypothetical protein
MAAVEPPGAKRLQVIRDLQALADTPAAKTTRLPEGFDLAAIRAATAGIKDAVAPVLPSDQIIAIQNFIQEITSGFSELAVGDVKRVLFEQILETLPPVEQVEIWKQIKLRSYDEYLTEVETAVAATGPIRALTEDQRRGLRRLNVAWATVDEHFTTLTQSKTPTDPTDAQHFFEAMRLIIALYVYKFAVITLKPRPRGGARHRRRTRRHRRGQLL